VYVCVYADYYVFETTVNDNPAIPEAPGVFVCVCVRTITSLRLP